QILDPVMRDIEAFLGNSQQHVTGNVFVQLMPYHFQITGIESEYDLMSSKFGKYGEMNTGWTGDDVRGFSKIFGNQTSIYYQIEDETVQLKEGDGIHIKAGMKHRIKNPSNHDLEFILCSQPSTLNDRFNCELI